MKRKKLIRVTTIDGSIESLLKGQLRYMNDHFEVVAVANDSGKLALVTEREGVRCVGVPMHREISLFADIVSLVRLFFLFLRERPYIVHANTPKGSLLAMVAAFFACVPHRIYTVTGLRFETTKGNFRRLLIGMERMSCLFATKVIPEGEGVKATLLRENVTKKPLQKILNGNINGIDVKHFSPEALEAADRRAAFTYIFIGRLVKDKGINELISAFKRLNSEFEDTRLLLVGTFEQALDPIREDTVAEIESNRAIDHVGYQMDIRPYLLSADVLTFPSYREGFPNVVLQAGAIGLPAIVTDINGCNEIIIEGENGTIIAKEDEEALYAKMREFYIKRDDEVAAMAKHSRDMIVSRYEQSALWSATLDMYNEL